MLGYLPRSVMSEGWTGTWLERLAPTIAQTVWTQDSQIREGGNGMTAPFPQGRGMHPDTKTAAGISWGASPEPGSRRAFHLTDVVLINAQRVLRSLFPAVE